MASDQMFSTNDIRSASVDYKRDNENKHKWAQGEAWGPGRPVNAHGRPARVIPRLARTNKELGMKDFKTAQRHEISEETFNSGDSSADEDPVEPSAAPAPDAEITYSFDAHGGPSHGSQILSLAVAKAVERYENTVTEKLVNEEYEVLDDSGEAMDRKPAKTSKKPGKHDLLINEEEYEFV